MQPDKVIVYRSEGEMYRDEFVQEYGAYAGAALLAFLLFLLLWGRRRR